MNLGSFFIFSLNLRHKCVVVPATVAAVRPAGTNHALSLIKIVIVIFGVIGFVGGADVKIVISLSLASASLAGPMTSAGMTSGDDVRTSGDGAGDGGGGRPDHLDQAPGEPSETATASHQWWTRRCLARWWVRQQLEPLLLLLLRPSRPYHLVFPPPHHPPQLSFVHFPFPSPSPLPSLKICFEFSRMVLSILENESPNLYILINKSSHKYL